MTILLIFILSFISNLILSYSALTSNIRAEQNASIVSNVQIYRMYKYLPQDLQIILNWGNGNLVVSTKATSDGKKLLCLPWREASSSKLNYVFTHLCYYLQHCLPLKYYFQILENNFVNISEQVFLLWITYPTTTFLGTPSR